MPSRLNYEPYDVEYCYASVLTPADPNYADDAGTYGIDAPDGQFIVGIGADHPDVVLTGSRDDLIRIFRDALTRLGA